MSLAFASAYRSLRPGEKAFVDGYVADVEAQQARRHERISLALSRTISAREIADSRGMLDKPMVRAAIVERINQLAADQELSPARVIKELMCMGFASLSDYMEIDDYGDMQWTFEKCTPEQLRGIKKYKVEENLRGGRKVEIELYDKPAVLATLARYMGIVDGNGDLFRAENAKSANKALPATVTVDGAGEAYGRLING